MVFTGKECLSPFWPGRGGEYFSGSCAARTLEPLAYTRASFSWILLPYTRVNSLNHVVLRAPVAQLIEHRVVMREVVSSTPAGPTLRVLLNN